MTKALFGAVIVTGCAMAAAGVVFATPAPLTTVPASSSCPAATGK
ncbi:hypothetical protein ACQEUU_08125 [Nonomuraea sp. CA-218870]